MREIVSLEKQVDWQRDQMVKMNQHIGNLPRSGSQPKGYEEAFSIISEVEGQQLEKLIEYAGIIKESEKVISGIIDDETRLFVRLLYVDQLSRMRIQRVMRMSPKRMRRMREAVDMAENMENVWNIEKNANKME